MGSEANALIGFGFELDRYEDVPEAMEEEEDGAEDLYLRRTGFFDNVPEPDFEKDEESWSAWLKLKQAALDTCPCVLHDWGEESGPILVCVKVSQIKGDWEGLKRLNLEEMSALAHDHQGAWNEQLKAFCEVMGLPFKEPHWFLTAYYF